MTTQTERERIADAIDPLKRLPDEIRRGAGGERLRYLNEHSVLIAASDALRTTPSGEWQEIAASWHDQQAASIKAGACGMQLQNFQKRRVRFHTEAATAIRAAGRGA